MYVGNMRLPSTAQHHNRAVQSFFHSFRGRGKDAPQALHELWSNICIIKLR